MTPEADPSRDRELQFPALESMCYLNTASIGLMPLSAQFAAEQFGRQLGLYGTTWFDEPTEVGALDEARVAAAGLLRVPADTVAVTTSVTEALSQVAWSLKPEAGTNIVSVDLDFPSVTYPWMRVAADTGAEVRLVGTGNEPASLSIDAVARLVDERTSVICLSHVQYSTGLRFDLDELSELARGCDAWLIIDASQSLGMVPIDLADWPVDALLCAGYKWLCGPFGAAICAVSPRLQERLAPPFVGWKSAVEPYSMDASELALARSPVDQLEYSTMAYGAGVALAGATRYVAELGVDSILEHDLRLAATLADGLDRLGAEVISPRDDDRRSAIVTARFPGRDSEEVAAWLNQSGVIVSPRFGSTRFSVHFFNTDADVERALDTLEATLDRNGPVETAELAAATGTGAQAD